MITQYRTVFKFIFFISFFINSFIQSQQLALPKQVLAIVSEHKITVNEFVDRYSDYLFSSGIKENIITRRSILNNMIGEYLLLDNVTLSIITKIGFLNNQSQLPRVLKHRKVFYFNSLISSHKINEENYDKTKTSKLIGKFLQQHNEPVKFNT